MFLFYTLKSKIKNKVFYNKIVINIFIFINIFWVINYLKLFDDNLTLFYKYKYYIFIYFNNTYMY